MSDQRPAAKKDVPRPPAPTPLPSAAHPGTRPRAEKDVGRGNGRDTPCANCGHRYGRHTLADCQEMIPIHGGAKSCDCPGWTSVLSPRSGRSA